MLRAKALGQQFLFINKTCFFLHFEAEKRQVFYFGKIYLEKQLNISAVRISIFVFAFHAFVTNCKNETAQKPDKCADARDNRRSRQNG